MYMGNIWGRNSCNYKIFLLSSTKKFQCIHILRKIYCWGLQTNTQRMWFPLIKDLTYLINGFTYLTYGCHAHALVVLLKDNTAVTCILSDVYISHVDWVTSGYSLHKIRKFHALFMNVITIEHKLWKWPYFHT